MTDERLAELRREWRSRSGVEGQGIYAAQYVPDLLDEVARLGAVVDEYREVIELHHADFRKIKEIATLGLRQSKHVVSSAVTALTAIDRIVR